MARHKNSSREAWLKEAKKVVIKKGVEAVSVDGLSKKLGVAKTSFYHFFESKKRFLELLFTSGIQDSTDKVIKEIYALDPEENKVEKLIEIVFEKNLPNELFLRRLRTYGMHSQQTSRLIKKLRISVKNSLKTCLLSRAWMEAWPRKRHTFFMYTL